MLSEAKLEALGFLSLFCLFMTAAFAWNEYYVKPSDEARYAVRGCMVAEYNKLGVRALPVAYGEDGEPSGPDFDLYVRCVQQLTGGGQ